MQIEGQDPSLQGDVLECLLQRVETPRVLGSARSRVTAVKRCDTRLEFFDEAIIELTFLRTSPPAPPAAELRRRPTRVRRRGILIGSARGRRGREVAFVLIQPSPPAD
jgi:hypothetical protein